jgi:hypothetical protein
MSSHSTTIASGFRSATALCARSIARSSCTALSANRYVASTTSAKFASTRTPGRSCGPTASILHLSSCTAITRSAHHLVARKPRLELVAGPRGAEVQLDGEASPLASVTDGPRPGGLGSPDPIEPPARARPKMWKLRTRRGPSHMKRRVHLYVADDSGLIASAVSRRIPRHAQRFGHRPGRSAARFF